MVHWSGRRLFWITKESPVSQIISDELGEIITKKGHDAQDRQMIILIYKCERICLHRSSFCSSVADSL